jgi:hypothetical protein
MGKPTMKEMLETLLDFMDDVLAQIEYETSDKETLAIPKTIRAALIEHDKLKKTVGEWQETADKICLAKYYEIADFKEDAWNLLLKIRDFGEEKT